MEGILLRVFFLLLASRGGSGQLLGDLCYRPIKAPGTHMVAYNCPGFQDPANARFCCGTCSEPFCCSFQKNNLDPTRCPAFDPVPEPTSSTTPAPKKDSSINVLWCLIGITIGGFVLWGICRSCIYLKWRRFCLNRDGDDEEEEAEVEMEERRSPAPPPPVLQPPLSPPGYIDYPPPYSAIDNFPTVPVSVINTPLGMGPTEGATPAQLGGAEGGSPPRLGGAEDGSPSRLVGAEGGSPPRLGGAESGARSRHRGVEWEIPARFREAEWGDPPPPYPDDPPPYSAIDHFASPSLPPPVARPPRRKRRAKVSWSVEEAPAEPAGAVGGAPAVPAGAVGGAPAVPAGAVGGDPAEPAGAVGGDPAEPAGAVGGDPAEPPGAEGGVPAEPPEAEGRAFAM